MTDVAGSVPQKVERGGGRSLRELVAATEIDLRLLGIVAALAAILIGFGVITGGKFLEPVNIVALSVQTASVAIIATGMVLVIVSRNIDLSVGSIVGVVAMTYALLMTDWLPHLMGFDNPFMWLVALVIGLAVGGLIGAFQGFIIAYIGVPSFVVTLGGLLAFRGVVFVMSSGASVSGLDPNFQLLGGGPEGSIGRDGELDRRRHHLRGHHRPALLRPAPATPVRLRGATDVGRGAHRRDRLRHRARGGRLLQRLPVAGRPRPEVRRGPQHLGPAWWPADRGGHPLPDRDRAAA